MASIYCPPPGFEPPKIVDWKTWKEDEANYIERLTTHVKEGSTDPLVGKIIRFQVADGYAQYMIWNTKPLQLIHLETGDAWQIPAAHARGLTLSDVKAMIKADEAWEELFRPKIK